MNRTQLTKTKIEDDKYRYHVTIESDPCPPNTQIARFLQFELLKTMAGDPAVTALGGSDFQVMKMFHDGARWIVDLEAISAT